MSIPITGDDDNGPASCVGRFIRASTAGDEYSAREELHPDSRAMAEEGGMEAPPMTAVELGEPIPGENGVQVPALLHNGDSEQRFVFVVRQVEEGWGIDLMASMQATFGGDPMAMLGDAMKEAMAPVADAMGAIGGAIQSAFGGSDEDESSERPARRVAVDEELPEGAINLEEVTIEVIRISMETIVEREFGDDNLQGSRHCNVRCGFRLPPGWVAMACTGVTLTVAQSQAGDDLIPEYNDGSIGAESYASWERESGDYKVGFALAAPPSGFTGLASLAGTIHLRLEGDELLEVVIGPFADIIGQEIPIAALDMNVVFDRDEEGRVRVTGPYDGLDRFAEMDVFDGSGEKISYGYSGYGDGETSTRVYDCPGEDDLSIRLRFSSKSGLVSIPFVAGGLPLQLT
jgi:hypothetical protein